MATASSREDQPDNTELFRNNEHTVPIKNSYRRDDKPLPANLSRRQYSEAWCNSQNQVMFIFEMDAVGRTSSSPSSC